MRPCLHRIWRGSFPVHPQSKQAPRPWGRNPRRRYVTDPAKRAYVNDLRLLAQACRPPEMLAGPLRLDVDFYFGFPASWPMTRKLERLPRPKPPDLDNMLKPLKDALKGVVYEDDAQVTTCHASKWYGDRDGIEVRVIEL